MNFFNDSFKTLKNVLEEKINFDETEQTPSENEKFKEICQHQLKEVISKLFYYDMYTLLAKIENVTFLFINKKTYNIININFAN